jgi:hypothetical protein
MLGNQTRGRCRRRMMAILQERHLTLSVKKSRMGTLKLAFTISASNILRRKRGILPKEHIKSISSAWHLLYLLARVDDAVTALDAISHETLEMVSSFIWPKSNCRVSRSTRLTTYK